MMHHQDRHPRLIDADRIDEEAMIRIHARLWEGFFYCPTTGKVVPSLRQDDKVSCGCGISNPSYPQECTERTLTHVSRYLRTATVEAFVEQEILEWRARARTR